MFHPHSHGTTTLLKLSFGKILCVTNLYIFWLSINAIQWITAVYNIHVTDEKQKLSSEDPSDIDDLQQHLMTWQPIYAAFVGFSLPWIGHSGPFPYWWLQSMCKLTRRCSLGEGYCHSLWAHWLILALLVCVCGCCRLSAIISWLAPAVAYQVSYLMPVLHTLCCPIVWCYSCVEFECLWSWLSLWILSQLSCGFYFMDLRGIAFFIVGTSQ